MKKIRDLILKHLNGIVGVVFLLGVAAVVFFIVFPFNVGQIKKINIIEPVQAGETIQYNVDYCRYVPQGTPQETHRYLIPQDRSLVNSVELSTNPSTETLDSFTGCKTTAQPIKLPVDAGTPAGKYQLLIKVTYCLYRVRCITVEGRSDFFDISRPNIEKQISVLNKGVEQLNKTLAEQGYTGAVVSTLKVPTPQTVTPPTIAQPQATQPAQIQPPMTTVTPKPTESCSIDILAIRLLCTSN